MIKHSIQHGFLTLGLAAACACGGTSATDVAEEVTQSEVVANISVPAGDLDGAIAGMHRTNTERARDPFRHPKETLEFFGFAPGQTVLEIWPGRLWYTKILAPVLREDGQLVVATTDPDADGFRGTLARDFNTAVTALPQVYGELETVVLSPPNHTNLGDAERYDLIVTFRNTHNWMQDNVHEQLYAELFRVLKPGGRLGVVQHRDHEGAAAPVGQRRGYVAEQVVIDLLTGIGFELSARSEINANPADTKDYPEHVWSLPPGFREGDTNRARYAEIGESDRMTLLFVKPAEGHTDAADPVVEAAETTAD